MQNSYFFSTYKNLYYFLYSCIAMTYEQITML
nr:MAG TPA: hypothetical protein [Caudoviricetes sp.]DAN24908.1 MAG TPA: hypothetical protein [Caudoviricetes sp.]DAR87526.1 MAG TPA: hypothetical protein [Caudoviricetes sp.]DAY06028.1 MAG TPA: hypothetical protein [Caudoviricetes sp.]